MTRFSTTLLNAWKPLLAAISFTLLGAWTADALKGATPFLDWLDPTQRTLALGCRIAIAGVLLIALATSVYGLYASRRVWLPVRTLGQTTGHKVRRRKVLVLCLSTPQKQFAGIQLSSSSTIELTPGGEKGYLSLACAKKDCAKDALSGLNWQQGLRAIQPHAQGQLAHLLIVPSKSKTGDPGSDQFAAKFKQWIAHYQKDPTNAWTDFSIEVRPAVDYEDFHQLHSAFVQVLHWTRQNKLDESDVVFDITSGQKPTSIAAAMVTLASGADFQYVQTTAPFDTVTYAVVAESPPNV